MMKHREAELVLDVPVARILVRGTPLGVTRVSFLEMSTRDKTSRPEAGSDRWEQAVRTWFDAYFSKGNAMFSPLLRPAGTEFQKAVWNALRAIPPGQTKTYGAVASAIGREDAARAVGRACGGNPVPILIPCHRVIPAGNGIGAYNGPDGLKRQLLEHESQKSSG